MTSYCRIACALNNIGVSMMLHGEFDHALSTFKDALNILRMVLAPANTKTNTTNTANTANTTNIVNTGMETTFTAGSKTAATTATTTTITNTANTVMETTFMAGSESNNTGGFTTTTTTTTTTSCASSIGTTSVVEATETAHEESIRLLDSFAKDKFQLASSRLSQLSTLSSSLESSKSRAVQQRKHVLQGLLLTIDSDDFQSLQEAATTTSATFSSNTPSTSCCCSSSTGTCGAPLYAILIREYCSASLSSSSSSSSSSSLFINQRDMDRESGIILYNYGLARYLSTFFISAPIYPQHQKQHQQHQQQQQIPKQWPDHHYNQSKIDTDWTHAFRSLSMAYTIFFNRLDRSSSSSSRCHNHRNNRNNNNDNNGTTQSRNEQTTTITTYAGFEVGGNTSSDSRGDDDNADYSNEFVDTIETLFLSILVLSCMSRVLRSCHDIDQAQQVEWALQHLVLNLQQQPQQLLLQQLQVQQQQQQEREDGQIQRIMTNTRTVLPLSNNNNTKLFTRTSSPSVPSRQLAAAA